MEYLKAKYPFSTDMKLRRNELQGGTRFSVVRDLITTLQVFGYHICIIPTKLLLCNYNFLPTHNILISTKQLLLLELSTFSK